MAQTVSSKFNNTRLERAKLKRQREENPVAESGPLYKRRSMGRKKLERNKDLFFFLLNEYLRENP